MSHWVFDLDGTLVDSFSHYFNLLSEIFPKYGARFTPELQGTALTHSLPLFFEEHLGKEAAGPALEELQTRSNEDARSIRPFPGIAELLTDLRQAGGRVAVWTNRDLVSASLILEHSGLMPHVELCISGSCVTERKPHPEGLLRILNHFGCEGRAVTMIGDHEYDVLGAKSAGAKAVRASWHAYWSVETCRHADVQFHDVPTFAAWARNLKKPFRASGEA